MGVIKKAKSENEMHLLMIVHTGKIEGPHACKHCRKRIPRQYMKSHKKDCVHTDLTETLKGKMK